MSKQFFSKKQQVMQHYHFFYVLTYVKLKACTPSLCSTLQKLFTLPLYACMKQIFLMKEGISLHIWFLKLVYSEEKSLRFDFNHKHIVEAKMLIKLVVVDSNDLIRYKCKIAHCLDFQTLSEYISTIALDNNQKLSMNEVLEVLICVGAFTSTSSFDT